MTRTLTEFSCLAALSVARCGGSNHSPAPGPASTPTPASAPRVASTPGYPDSIVVIGHSGATGEDSDPTQPHVEIRANSWATGTNPAVHSVYQRILAKNPAIRGHNFNLAQRGATVEQLMDQARNAVQLKPKPLLVLIQTIDNDMACPANAADYASFRSNLLSVLHVLARGLPKAKLFIVSQLGSPITEWQTYTLAQRRQFGGTGPSDYPNPQGKVVAGKLARLVHIIRGYETQVKVACAQVQRCFFHGPIYTRQVHRRQYVAEDLNHLTVAGHAWAASPGRRCDTPGLSANPQEGAP
jgi:GDSL-like Lipase/Acylhydrolase